MGKNNSKWNDWQRINFQNIQAAHTTQYQKNKQPNQKVGKRSKQTFFKEDIQIGNKHMKRYSTSLIIREMKIRTTEISPHTRQNGHHQKIYKQQVLERVWRKGNSPTRWWECKFIQPLWKTVWSFLYKTRNKTTMWPSNTTSRHTSWRNQNWKRHMYPNVHCSTVVNRHGSNLDVHWQMNE